LNIFPLKPSVIIQLGALLENKSLDNLVKEQESIKKQEEEGREEKKKDTTKPIDMIMKMGANLLLEEYPFDKFEQLYHLLFILCSMPKGLYDIDIEQICKR
jgi:hypothetical protein